MAQGTDAKRDSAAQSPPLRLSRVLHARRETVFKVWSSAEHVKRWFAPETYTVPQATVQMHAGGLFELCMRSPAGEEHWIRGRSISCRPTRSLI